MKNQFFYQRKIQNPPVEGETEPTFKYATDSFNINFVVRSYMITDTSLLVVLNDFHEEVRQEPVVNKQNVVTSYKNSRNTYQSEITLDGEDITRFRALTEFK